MYEVSCPTCHSAAAVVKAGRNPSGTQRYRCHTCQHYFTPAPKEQGLGATLRGQALKLHLEGMSFRAVARVLNVNHQTVVNWVSAAATTLPPQVSVPEAGETVEIDELFTFMGTKKKKAPSS